MMGGMLAGHDQSGGEIKVKDNGTKVKLFYGMSSATAMEKHSGGVAEYRQERICESMIKLILSFLILHLMV